MPKRTLKLGNGWIAALLACIAVVILTLTASSTGLTWDEPNYIAAAKSYAGWFGVLVTRPATAFRPEVINQFWDSNHEHPPVDKVWLGLVWSAARHVFNDLTAVRLGNILLVGLLIALVYLWIAEMYGRGAGLFAAGALMAMPRFFFHAHLAALDVPVSVGIFGTTFLFWKTADRKEWWWGLILGLAWGLAEGMKLNATFLPIGLALWFLLFRRRWYLALRFVMMGAVAVLTFVLAWPWLYYHTWSRIWDYYKFHSDHYKIGQWYFGHYYVPPPWHFVFVMLWAVVPLTLLALAVIGAARAGWGRKDKGSAWLLVISAIVPLLPFVVAKSLAYDGDRLFMPTFPFLACLAGVGFGWLIGLLRKWFESIKRPAILAPAGFLLAGLLFLPQVVTMIGLYPHLLSYYSEGVGGLPGATRMQLETTYWCETYAAAIPYINAHAQPGDKIWVEPYSYDVMIYYQLIGRLRPDVEILHNTPGAQSLFGPSAPQPVYGEFIRADWILYEYRQTQIQEFGGLMLMLPDFLQNMDPPAFEISYQGVPIMKLYHR
ncbi:MAG TPA: glycosyltransferase family 39 protein [Anaerolineales bacterium]|nr:glycosyltransferase family 39 protein [Anaerolineales bacterium]